ncbi:MAG TPA: C25 family cysteine peptidase [Lentimicrobium sp.]|nr:C25 family cysteine peptidase [Lentimicrobium sp.]
MKQLLFIILSLFLSFQVSSQETITYSLNNNLSSGTSINVGNIENTISVDIQLGSFNILPVQVNGNNAFRIRLDEGVNITGKGQPDIQYLSVSIAIPNTGKTVPIINTADYKDYPAFEIAPSAGDPGVYFNTSEVVYDNEIYSSNSFFPKELVVANDPYIYGGTRGQALHFFPVQYNPVTKVLRIYSHINITVTSINEPGVNELVAFSPAMGILDNMSAAHFSNNQDKGSSGRYMSIEEQGKMLIIAHPSFIESMKPFVEWKNQKGIQCEMVDVSTLGNANQIKQFISDYYYKNGLTYLLLVGDEKYVATNNAEKGASDNMYAYIAGNDHYPEIMVGRFSCETVRECDIMVQRSLNYEKNPAGGQSYNNFLGIGSGSGPGDDDELDFQHIRNIGKTIKNSVFSTITEMYDGSQGDADKDGNPTSSMVADAINGGQSCIMYIGHGTVNNWITSGFSSTDAEKLKNTETYPFIWSAGCDNGEFIGTACFAEFLLRAENNGKPTGAIGALMSSAGQSWFPPMEAQDEIALILSGKKSNNTSVTFGGISLSGCMRMNDKYGQSGFIVTDNWILFGDPSIEIRTSSPKQIKAIHATTIGNDASSFTISGLDSSMFAAVSVNGTLLTTAKPVDGIALINLPVIKEYNKLILTITAKNCIPYISEIQLTSTPSVAINPYPGNYNNKISIATTFGWNLNAGVTPRSFTFCIRPLGSSNWSTYNVNSAIEISIPELEYLTTYEWKVISHADVANTESSVFIFTTIDRPDEDFEQEGFPRNNWLNTQEWYVDNSEYFEGHFALHSGNTVSREFSSLYYECETKACDYISFEIKLNAVNPGANIGFYLDDFLVAEWNYTMGWTNMTYQIEPGRHTFEWRFTGGDTTNNESAAWLDNIYLPINEAVVFGNTSQEVCASNSILLEATVSNHASLLWNTTGTGFFDDPEKANAIYYPSEQDLLAETVLLTMDVKANNTCPAEIYNYEIRFASLPELSAINDTTLYSDESFKVTGSDLYEKMYIHYGTDTLQSPVEIDPSHLNPGENTITVVGENALGCSITKQFKINLIPTTRPVASLSIYPNPTAEQISINNPESGNSSIISIYSIDGLLIEQHTFEGYGVNTVQVRHLNPGIYMVRSETNGKTVTGKFIKI